jgi:hypothetical protein
VLILGTGAAWAQASPPPQSPPRQQASQRDEASQRDLARQREERRAQERREQERREREREQAQRDQDSQRGGLPASVRRVERQTGGEVLRAEPMQRDGREVYRLKVLTADGRVRVVQDDPDRPRSEASEERPAGRKGRQQEQTSRDSDEDPPQ